MNNPMKQSTTCDTKALSEALQQLKISAVARHIGQYMVDKIGYDYAIMVYQLRKGLGLKVEAIEMALQELVDQKFIRQQPRAENKRSWILDRKFLATYAPGEGKAFKKEFPPASLRAQGKPILRVIMGGKA